MSLVTFVIPSKGRPTLANTLCSLYEQTRKAWNAVVIFDAVEPTINSYDNKIMVIESKEKLGIGVNGAGNVRNLGIRKALTPEPFYTEWEPCEWFGFVDDDDCLYENYVQDLAKEAKLHPEADCIVFRMQFQDGLILPPYTDHIREDGINKLENKVGISFAIKPHVFIGSKEKQQIEFNPSSGEDYNFLKRIHDTGYQIHISNHITYNVSPLGCAPDRRPK